MTPTLSVRMAVRIAVRMVLSLAALALAACGAPAATSSERTQNARHDESTSASTNGGSGEVIVAGHPACPARFGEQGPRCAEGDDPGICTYPEGTCQCLVPVWCGGAAPPPMPASWTCEAPRPPCPPIGTPCTAGSPSCPTDACGFDRIECVEGTWQQQMGPYPP